MASVKSLAFRTVISAAVAAAISFFPRGSSCYEPGTEAEPSTHPLLAQKSAKFYGAMNEGGNLGSPITDEQMRQLMRGAIEEDEPFFRSFRHFTDWQTDKGIFVEGQYSSSKEWLHNEEEQGRPNLGGNFTWERAARDHDYEALGHILHLIEDASVPAHVRNDIHPGLARFGLRDVDTARTQREREWILRSYRLHGDGFEFWADQNNRALDQIFPAELPYFDTIDEIMDAMIQYTGRNFVSDDTAFTGYSLPARNQVFERRLGKKTYYYSTIDGEEVAIARKGFLVPYVLDNLVLADQSIRLFRKTTELGAAAILLFKKETERLGECHSDVSRGCSDGDLYWFNSCGEREEIAEDCPPDAPCDPEACCDGPTVCHRKSF